MTVTCSITLLPVGRDTGAVTEPPQPPTALTIAGSDSGGGAGAQADLKTFLACRVHGMSAITAVTVQNSLGVSEFHEIPPHVVAEQIESVATDIGVGAAKTGMLASAEIMAAVAEVVARLGITPFVVDPVAASQHGDPLLRPDALDGAARRRSSRWPTLITPNLGEVRLLTGLDVDARADRCPTPPARCTPWGRAGCWSRAGTCPAATRSTCSTTGPTSSSSARRGTRPTHTHGSGDTLASAITAGLARGLAVPDAVREGKAFIAAAVAGSFPLGAGLGPVGHFWRVRDWPLP